MIRKLRLKFVAICMTLVTAILAAVFLSVFFAVEQNIETISRGVLQQVIREERHPDVGITIDGDPVPLPYFTVNVWAHTAYVTGGTYADLENTETLTDILAQCLTQDREEGTISAYHLRYLRQDNGLYQKIAFVDMSLEMDMLHRVMFSYLRIGLAALLLLLGVSILLSRWATRPVEKAWKQQRQFLSDASHELKTPLTVILSNAELLESAPWRRSPPAGRTTSTRRPGR